MWPPGVCELGLTGRALFKAPGCEVSCCIMGKVEQLPRAAAEYVVTFAGGAITRRDAKIDSVIVQMNMTHAAQELPLFDDEELCVWIWIFSCMARLASANNNEEV
jgi:hypothetical protein